MKLSFGGGSAVSKALKSQNNVFIPKLEALEPRTLLATYVVTNTSADPNTANSLPWAVNQVNFQSHGGDTIDFNIPGAGPHVITINQTLFLNAKVNVDGTSQPGYSGKPLISVQGNPSVGSLFLLQGDPSNGDNSSGSTIQGLDMYDYSSNGNAVTIEPTSSNDTIKNNWMGFFVDPSGGVHLESQLFSGAIGMGAVGIQSSNNTLSGNTISGTFNGVRIGEDPFGAPWSGTVYKNNSLQHNFIGTDPTGSTAMNYGNVEDGIFLGAGAQNNFLGPNNVISGNGVHGIEFLAPSVIGNVLFKDFIGTNAAGTVAIPNLGQGILFANGSNGNTIGGAMGGNVISGNLQGGIEFGTGGFGAANGNFILNNIIGLNSSQTAAIPNGHVGIALGNGSAFNTIQGNTIAGNDGVGIALFDGVNNNIIGQNTFGANSQGNLNNIGLHKNFLFALLDQLLGGVESVNPNGTTTVTDNFFGLPLVFKYDTSGNLVSFV